MKNLSRDGFTDEQIRNALISRETTRTINFRFDLIRNGAIIKQLKAEGSVSLDVSSEIKRTARFRVYDTDIDFLTDYIKPYMLLKMPDKIEKNVIEFMPVKTFDMLDLSRFKFDKMDLSAKEFDDGEKIQIKGNEAWASFPLGVFIPSTVTELYDHEISEKPYYDIEAYDLSVILKEDSLNERLFFSKGTKYLDAIQYILISAGIQDVFISDWTDTAFLTDREFETGQRKLDLCNTILSEINYNEISCDENGRFIISKYIEIQGVQIDHIYRDDENSVLLPQFQIEMDYFNTPNIFVAICNNPELKKEYRSVYINDNPISELSVTRRNGRRIVSEEYRPDMIETQEQLDQYIRRIAFEKSQICQTIEFSTAVMPIHGERDKILLTHDDKT